MADGLAKMEELSKSMCDCKDKDCADKVNGDMTTWATEMAKNAGAAADDKPDPEMAKKSADIMTKYTDCMTKLRMAGAKPAPATPELAKWFSFSRCFGPFVAWWAGNIRQARREFPAPPPRVS